MCARFTYFPFFFSFFISLGPRWSRASPANPSPVRLRLLLSSFFFLLSSFFFLLSSSSFPPFFPFPLLSVLSVPERVLRCLFFGFFWVFDFCRCRQDPAAVRGLEHMIWIALNCNFCILKALFKLENSLLLVLLVVLVLSVGVEC